MGRKKLVDYFRIDNSKDQNDKDLTPQEAFMRYLESRVKMIYTYTMRRWGVKPSGYLNAVELSAIKTNWGYHYVLNIVFPHSMENYYKTLRGLIHYILGVFPIPQMVSLKIMPAKQYNEDVDLITIEVRYVLIAIQS